MTTNATEQTKTECTRCGTCCQKGGPAFHLEDKHLLAEGKINMGQIYTIRQGEPVYDNVSDQIIAAETDIIKMRGKEGSWTCCFLEENNECGIYEKRPSECHLMKCWDTEAIETAYAKDRLTREHLLKDVEGLWDFIQEHQQECSYEIIRNLLASNGGELKGQALEHVLKMIKYDLAIRPMIAEKGQLDPEWVDFLLGRPIIETIALFGLQVIKDGDSYLIEPIQEDMEKPNTSSDD